VLLICKMKSRVVSVSEVNKSSHQSEPRLQSLINRGNIIPFSGPIVFGITLKGRRLWSLLTWPQFGKGQGKAIPVTGRGGSHFI
jgi:hypothetical protein